MWPVSVGAPKRPPKLALVCSEPASRQPAGTQAPHVPSWATRSSSTPSSGVSAAGHNASRGTRSDCAPASTPIVLPASTCVKCQVPSDAASATRRSLKPSACTVCATGSRTCRSPCARSNTTSAVKPGALCTSMCPPTTRSPPQPYSGCSRASSGATAIGSS